MKILIADDETLVRKSILLFLKDLGIEAEDIEEADTGLSMLEHLKHSHFDLALVDIRMPSMDGLEAIREGCQISPYTDFYVLSGFDDFKYAQEAIRLGVKDYLLKPLTRGAAELILEKTISSLERNRAQLIDTLNLYVVSLLNLPDRSLTIPQLCHPLLIVNDIPKKTVSLSEFMENHDEKIIMIPYRLDDASLLFLFETPEHPGYYNELLKKLSVSFLDSYTIIEGKPFINSQQWNSDYARIQKLARFRPIYGSRRIYHSNCHTPHVKPELESLCHYCLQSLSSFSCSDYAGFSIACDNILQNIWKLEQTQPSPVSHILDFLKDAYQFELITSEDLKRQLLTVSSMMIRIPSSKEFNFDDISSYLGNHYMEELTLTGVAALYGLSPNYFSTLFKKNAGCNFVSYLTKLRIEKGKRLLMETRLTIREIAGQVGYYSTSFFIRAFKKSEGKTPSEYRKGVN